MYLDNDLYQWLMSQIIWYEFPDWQTIYSFKNRGPKLHFSYMDLEQRLMDRLAERPLYSDIKVLEKTGYFREEYLDDLVNFQIPHLTMDWQQDLGIRVQGYWHSSILAETPILAQVANRHFLRQPEQRAKGLAKLELKIEFLNEHPELKLVEFGSRRRASYTWQQLVLRSLVNLTENIIGTSNVALAHKFNIKAIGTQAHQMFMVLEPIYGKQGAQQKVIELWNKYYPGHNIFLTDTYTTDFAMLNITDLELESLDGFRQDSGPWPMGPHQWTQKILDRLEEAQLDPTTYQWVYSDNLNIYRSHEIYDCWADKLGPDNISFGIGNNLTYDLEYAAPNMVIKPSHLLHSGIWTCYKLSDDPAKATR